MNEQDFVTMIEKALMEVGITPPTWVNIGEISRPIEIGTIIQLGLSWVSSIVLWETLISFKVGGIHRGIPYQVDVEVTSHKLQEPGQFPSWRGLERWVPFGICIAGPTEFNE